MMIYLDNSATTKPYKDVLDTMTKVASDYFANPSSIHSLGGRSEQLLEKTRQQAAALLKVKERSLFFTSGGTEANNLAIKGVARQFEHRGQHLITSQSEHASVNAAFLQLEKQGFEVTQLPLDKDGRFSISDLKGALREDTILVSLIHVNNEMGTIQPIEEAADLLKDLPKTLLHVDHVQGLTKVPLDLNHPGIDLCSMSGHKIHGPKGIGLLYKREGLLLAPLLSGGSQEYEQRAGTENLPAAAGMVKALRMTLDKQRTEASRLNNMKETIIDRLGRESGIIINTPGSGSAPHIVNLTVRGLRAEVLIHALEESDIYISTKSACSSKEAGASPVLMSTGMEAADAEQAVRISLSYMNTDEEISRFSKVFINKINELRAVMR